jgi:UDP-N-acetyl-D-glucosamine dehydrogenase
VLVVTVLQLTLSGFKAASVKAGYMPELIQLARNTNNSMPTYTINLLQDSLNDCGYPIKGTTVAVLGVAYKKTWMMAWNHLFLKFISYFRKKGARIRVYDSWIKSKSTVESLEQVLQDVQAVVIVTDHENYVSQIKQTNLTQYGIKVIIDGRNCLESQGVFSQGILYRGIGRR